MTLTEMGQKAQTAAQRIGQATTEQKNLSLESLAENLIRDKVAILNANRNDLNEAADFGMESAMLDRLSLQGRLEGIVEDTRRLVSLPDPVGVTIEKRALPNGLSLEKRRTPIGVLGVIYESRPNVTVDVAALAIKTGNCALLRGGSESLHTNRVLVTVIKKSLRQANLPAETIQFIDSPDRSLVTELLKLHEYVDLIIPRGGAGLHAFCRENSRIPVITGGIGICHLFVDDSADQARSLKVIYNAKTQRPTVCNALDTILVHESIAADFIPKVLKKLGKSDVTFRLDPPAWEIFETQKNTLDIQCRLAGENDWDTEWLSLVLGISVVKNIDEAICHIRQHTTGHSDGILTENETNADRFVAVVDSACVYVNASTRFTDGSQFGLGAEVAISTQKLHARGPMGPEELTTYKWIVRGTYHTRD